MGFLDFIFGDNRSDNNYNANHNQSYSNEDYDDEDYSDEEYDGLYIDESDFRTHGIYSFEDTYDEEDWMMDIVNYPHRSFDPWKTIESHLELYSNFEEAEEYLKTYFRGLEKDIVYYFSMAYFYFRKAQEEGQVEDIQRAKSHIENAARNCNDDQIWVSLVAHIMDKISFWYTALREEKRLREEYKKEWGDLTYRTRYSNMDTSLPEMRKLAQTIHHQLSDARGSRDFIKTVESDLNNWENKYNTAKTEELLKNGNLDEAAKTASKISDMEIRSNLCRSIIDANLQIGDYDTAAKVATQIGDMGTQTLFSARIAAGQLLKMVKDKAPDANIRRQLFSLEDVLRRATSLLKDNDSFQSLQKDIEGAVATARKYLNGQSIESTTIETHRPVNTQAPISTANQSSDTASANEAEFIEELKACLEDGVLSAKHRRLLDRVRKSLGISEARAAELEAMCQPKSLTAKEQDYADEVRACLEDEGVITAKDRRLLSRIADSLGISAERAAEIESMMAK